MLIPPGEARPIALALHLKAEPGLVTRMVGLIVEDQGMRKVNFRVTGRIVPPTVPAH